jgi:hypothetical protein
MVPEPMLSLALFLIAWETWTAAFVWALLRATGKTAKDRDEAFLLLLAFSGFGIATALAMYRG